MPTLSTISATRSNPKTRVLNRWQDKISMLIESIEAADGGVVQEGQILRRDTFCVERGNLVEKKPERHLSLQPDNANVMEVNSRQPEQSEKKKERLAK